MRKITRGTGPQKGPGQITFIRKSLTNKTSRESGGLFWGGGKPITRRICGKELVGERI